MTCRHAPHGAQGTSLAFTTVTALISMPGPSFATAAKMAVRSAQLVSPYDAFSTLQPAMISPVLVSTAAPTWKLEYGAYACFVAARAAFNSCSLMAAELSMLIIHLGNTNRSARAIVPAGGSQA